MSRKQIQNLCNHDCFNCKYPDCILEDHLDYEDYQISRMAESIITDSLSDPRKKQAAAQQKAYREAHREEAAARQKAWYEAHREEWNAYIREYRRKKRYSNSAEGS